MQTASQEFIDAVNKAYVLYTQPKVIAEFNMNTSDNVQAVYNQLSDPGANEELFPISSIVESNRPNSGQAKAVVGQAKTSSVGERSRWQTVGPDAIYKYWKSAGVSSSSGNISGVEPTVEYASAVQCNKIRVRVENSISYPLDFTISIQLADWSWHQVFIGSNFIWDNTGKLEIYLQDNGAWSIIPNFNNKVEIIAVAFEPTQMSAVGKSLELIEIAGCLEQDITSDVISVSVTKNITNPSVILPMGDITSNAVSLSLDNTQGKYANSNINSPYYKILTPNVKLTVWLGVAPEGSFDSADLEFIQQGIFYVDTWGNESDYSVSVNATDFGKFLQSQDLVPTVYKNKTPGNIVRSILNMMGHDNFRFYNNISDSHKLPYFWVKSTDTAWSAMQAICQQAQIAIFYDEFEILTVMTREAFNALTVNHQTSYQLFGQPSGDVLANIINADHEYSTQVNQFVVQYQTLKTNSDPYGNPLTSNIWQPGSDGAVVNGVTDSEANVSVMSAYLKKDIDDHSSYTWITLDSQIVPLIYFSGYLLIDSEIVAYEGKQYVYYPTNLNNPVYTTVKSEDDINYINLNLSNQNLRNNNSLTGKVFMTRRGELGTKPAAHKVNIDQSLWNFISFNSTGGQQGFSNGGSYTQEKSALKLNGAGNGGTYSIGYHSNSDSWDSAGTQIYFPNDGNTITAGMVFGLNPNSGAGFYIEVSTTKTSQHLNIPEVVVHQITNSHFTKVGAGPVNIAAGVWYSIDVVLDPKDNSYNVYINDSLIVTIPNAAWAVFNSVWNPFNNAGHIGVFTIGSTNAFFEYVYSVKNNYGDPLDPLTASLTDVINGGYLAGTFFHRDILFNQKHNPVGFFDDFGPYAHEIREYTVTYQNPPVLSADIWWSNKKYVDVIDFSSSSFGAHFYVVNKNRGQIGNDGGAVVIGADATDSSTNPINQTMMIYGMVLTQGNQETLTITNTESYNNFGANSVTFGGQWIQSQQEARNLGNWATTYWGYPVETINASVWISPCVQLGDFIPVDFKAQNIYGNYYVSSINIGWANGGLTGSLGLTQYVNNHNINGAKLINTASGRDFASNSLGDLANIDPVVEDVSDITTVWWAWKAPQTGTVTFNTFGSNTSSTIKFKEKNLATMDTKLAVYLGILNGFSLITSNDNANNSPDPNNIETGGTTSEVTFNAAAGVTYYIAVSSITGNTDYVGYQNSDLLGTVVLHWAMV